MSRNNQHITPAHPVLRPSTVYEQLLGYLFISAAVAQGCGLFVCLYFALWGSAGVAYWSLSAVIRLIAQSFFFFHVRLLPHFILFIQLIRRGLAGNYKAVGILILCLFGRGRSSVICSRRFVCCIAPLAQPMMLCTAAEANGDEWMESEDVCRAAEAVAVGTKVDEKGY